MNGVCHFQAFGPANGERPPADHDLRLWPEYRPLIRDIPKDQKERST